MGLIKSRKFDENICRHNGFLHKYSNDRLFYHYTQQVRPIVKMNKVEFKDQILTLKKELYEDSNLTICYDSNITSRKLEDLGFNIYSLKKISDKFYGYKDNLECEDMASDLFLFIKEVLDYEEEFSKKYVVKCDIIGYRKEYFCPICGEKFSLYSRHFLELESLCSTHLFDDEHKIASASFYELFKFSVKQNLDDDNEIIKEIKYKADFLRMKKKMVFNKDTLCIYSINGLQRIGSEKLKAQNPYSIKNEVYNSHSRRNYLSECKDFYFSVYKFLLDNYEQDLEYILKDLKLLTERDNFMVYNIDEVENVEQLKQWIDNKINDNIKNDFYYVNLSEVLDIMYKILYVKKKYNINNTSLAIYCLTLRKVRPDILGKIKHLKDKDKLKALKINNKEIMEYMLDIHPSYFPLSLLLFGQLKDINNVKKLLQCSFLFSYDEKDYRKMISLTKEFLRKYKKGKDETVFVNRLAKDHSCLLDTLYMYNDLRKIENYSIDFSLSIKELHDIFSLDYKKIQNKNKKISQNKDLKKIFKNQCFEDIHYELAKDTYELIDVGSKMNICVGGYGDRAVRKDCYIVIGYNNQNEPVTCMELTKKEGIFKIEQVKKYRNNLAELNEQIFLINLFNSNSVNVPNRCYDLSMGIKNINEQEAC